LGSSSPSSKLGSFWSRRCGAAVATCAAVALTTARARHSERGALLALVMLAWSWGSSASWLWHCVLQCELGRGLILQYL
jgi:hypothetical protein